MFLRRVKLSKYPIYNKAYEEHGIKIGDYVEVKITDSEGDYIIREDCPLISRGEVRREEFVFVEQVDSTHPKDIQEGGDHYKGLKHQPLEVVLENEGYEAFRGACLAKLYKYTGYRNKGGLYKKDLKKAEHVLQWLLKETTDDWSDTRGDRNE